ncbi:MAG: helix-turn-helix transcriptional regulator [Lachnospiraceae bacterium]|nr:helix-turn-helix transcriptional regulator [Lachnospiraceae bacterium]MBR2995581.1 helix-turn-helix transcriptional regulator [Lachnospiraceae bacterium]
MGIESETSPGWDGVPLKYRQPVRGYIGRTVNDSVEEVDFVPGTHVRIWYNNQLDAYALHHHAAAEIVICMESTYNTIAANQLYQLNASDILIIPPLVPHRHLGGIKGTRFICLFDLSPLNAFEEFRALSSTMLDPIYLTRKSAPSLYLRVYESMMRVVDVYFSTQSTWEMAIFSELLNVFAGIGKDRLSESDNFSPAGSTHFQANYDKFSGLMLYLDEHYAEDISLEQAAELVGFSKFHFSRLFKEYAGTTFYDHLVRRRVRAAQELLSTSMSITEITFRTGWGSLTSFSRSFRKYTGMSPTEYRSLSEVKGSALHRS